METLYRRNDSRVWHICIMLCHVGLLTCPNKIEMLARDLSRKGNIIVKLNVWIIVTRCTDLGQISTNPEVLPLDGLRSHQEGHEVAWGHFITGQ